jgi:hypothetical protein
VGVAEAQAPQRSEADLEPGTRVDVRRRFDGHWAHGFEVVSVTDGKYLVRRLSDGSVLPTPFDPEEVRRERRKTGLWWY